MKNNHCSKIFAVSLGLAVAGILLFGSHSAQAQATYYWDENDVNPGFGTAGTMGTAWSPTTSMFTTDATGATAPTGTVVTGTSDAINFGASSALPLGSGTIAVSGTVGAGSITYSGSTGAITLSSGGTILLSGSVTMNTPSVQTINSNIDLTGAIRTFTWNTSGSGGSMIIGGSIFTSSGTAGITVAGSGSLTLAGTNTFNGNVQVAGNPAGSGSVLIVSSMGNQGSTTSNLGSGTTINLGSNGINGTLRYTGTGETSNRLFTDTSGNTASGALIDQSGTGLLTLTGSFTNSGAAKTLTLLGSGTGEYAGAITDGSGSTNLSLVKSGSGTWTLSGSNSYRGGTTVNGGGMLLIGNANALGTGALTLNNTNGGGTALINGAFTVPNAITASTSTTTIGGNLAVSSTFSGNISVNTSGFNVSQASGGTLTLSGTMSPSSSNRRVNFINVGNVLVTGPITGAQMALTQNGAGTTTLTGTNTYSQATTVSAGALIVSGSITASATTITNNATLGGAGGMQAVTTTAGTLSPGNLDIGGNSTVGTLSTKNLSATTSTAHLAIQLGSTSAGTTTEGYNIVNSDRVSATGTVDLTGADLNLLSIGTPAVNDVFFLLINDSTDAVTGQFGSYSNNGGSTVTSTLTEGSTITIGSQPFKLTYAANFEGNSFTGGNDIALQAQAVPEPSTWAMLLGGVGMLLSFQRWHRRRS